jgi:potassium-dependent mechanosensitive channel
MPELAEVEYYRRQWDVGIGARITAVQLHAEKRIFRGSDPRALVQTLTGSRLVRSVARGKQMLFVFSSGGWLGIHLGMSGALRTEPARFTPDKHDHLVLRQARRVLVFRDPRLFGRVRFHLGEQEPNWWSGQAAEIASTEFTARYVAEFLRRHARAPIKAVLLLQSGFPGIGNWMADEILWRAGIPPQTRSGELDPNQQAALRRATRFVSREALRIIGSDFADPPRSWLIHQRWKPGGHCPHHRTTTLQRATIGGRTTAWCAECQKGLDSPNAPERPRACVSIYPVKRRILHLTLALAVAASPLLAQGDKAATSPTPAEATAEAAAAVAPTPVPLADVVAAADAATERLQEVVADVTGNQTSATINAQLQALAPEIDARLDETRRLTTPGVPLDTIRELELRWQRIADQLAAWSADLTARATILDREIALLPELRTTWRATQEQARDARAPQELTQRIDSVLKSIDQSEAALQKRRATILSLQTRVAGQTQRVQAAMRSIRSAQAAAVGRLWVQDSAPIWSPAVLEAAGGNLVSQSQASFGPQVELLRVYAAREWTKFVYLALMFAALAFLLNKVKQKAARWTENDPPLDRANRILQQPFATAAILALLFAGPLFPEAPRLFWTIAAVIALAPLTVLLRRLLDQHLRPILYALVVLFLVAQFRASIASLPIVSRVVLLTEMIGGALFVAWFLRGRPRTESDVMSRTLSRVAARAGLALFGVVFVAASLGYMGLANYLAAGALSASYYAVLLYAAAGIVEGLVLFALQIRPLNSFRVVQQHRALLRRRTAQIIRFAAVVIWVLLSLGAFGIRDLVLTRISAVLNAEIAVRSLHFSLGAVLAFALTIWAALLISRFVRFVLEEEVYERVHLARGSSYAVSTVLHYLILLGGFFAALAATGVDMTRFAILAGAFGVGIGFGLQNIFNNFFSGLILLFERPVQVGDVVEIGPVTGVVQRIGIRASVIRLPDSAQLIVPNGQLISEKVTNRTFSSRRVRLSLRIGVAYESEPDQVLDLLKRTAAEHKLVAKDPAPEALLKEFAADALMFELGFWTETPAAGPQIQSEVAVAVFDAVRDAGIEIHPHRTVLVENSESSRLR